MLNTTQTLLASIATFICIVSSVIVVVLLAILTFNSPDPNTCWVIVGMDKSERTREQAIISATQLGVQVPQGYPVEMHKVFHAWVAWGFYTSVVFMSIFIFAIILMKYKEKAGQVISAVNFGISMTNFVIWVLLGTIWRFSAAGNIAAGGLLEKPVGMTDDVWSQQL